MQRPDYELENKIDELRETVERMQEFIKYNDSETEYRLDEMEAKTNLLDKAVKQRTFKVVISIIAGASLLLNILQILNII